MDLDFSKYPELDGPIVLRVGCDRSAPETLVLLNDIVIEANAQTVEIIEVDLSSRWWDDPTLPEKLHELLDLFPRKSKLTAMRWIETDDFVREVRKLLTQDVEQSTSLEELPANWPELVSLAILDVDTETSYVQRVFDGWFPNAKFRANCGAGKTVPIWRGGEVRELKPGPTQVEVLDWPLRQLPTRLSVGAIEKIANFVLSVRESDGTLRVHHLALVTRQVLADAKFTDNVIGGIEEALMDHHLWLGMTEDQIEQVRQGLVPTIPIAEIGRAASFGLTYPWGRDAD